jgi:hypothetical protein
MQVDAVLNQVRPFVQLAGSALILLGAVKFFGFNPGVSVGEGWQLVLVGFGLKHF